MICNVIAYNSSYGRFASFGSVRARSMFGTPSKGNSLIYYPNYIINIALLMMVDNNLEIK